MSRIGKKPVAIPKGVTVDIDGTTVLVKGPKGELKKDVHPEMQVSVADTKVMVARPSDEKKHKSLHGVTRTIIANMVDGVTKGYSKSLELSGVGYRATKAGTKLSLALGYTKPVEIEAPKGIEFDVPNPTTVIVKGIDKEQVGEMAAYIRGTKDPDPYKAKGVIYTGEVIQRKAGKTGKTGK